MLVFYKFKQKLKYEFRVYKIVYRVVIVSAEKLKGTMKNGYIQLICGPMFSGKSTQLLRQIKRFKHAGKQCLIINHSNSRHQSKVGTHNQQFHKAITASTLDEVFKQINDYDVIAIDDAHFFIDISIFSDQLANQGKHIIIAGLDSTFQRKPFENVLQVVPKAQHISKLTAICTYCAKQASFTMRIVECKQKQLVGGDQIYQPACRKCFHVQGKYLNSQ